MDSFIKLKCTYNLLFPSVVTEDYTITTTNSSLLIVHIKYCFYVWSGRVTGNDLYGNTNDIGIKLLSIIYGDKWVWNPI